MEAQQQEAQQQEAQQQEVLVLPKLPTKRGRKNAHSPGRSPILPCNGQPQLLLDERFMSSSQKQAHREGVAIYV
jgi:hypothetical protein